MQILHDGLPAEAQAKLLPNKKVTSVSTNPDGVTVTCADGTTYEGTIIVGADGAHSTVRNQMRTAALQTSSASLAANDEKPFLTTYRSMWIRFPTVSPINPGDASETHGYDCTLQLFAGEDTSVIGIYERMEKPTRDGARYNEEDELAFIKRWGHLPVIAGGMSIAEAYANRTQAGMVNLEEGILRHWSYDRIVLVGDAAHKFTPSTGAGCNNGIVDVVALANELYHAFRAVREAEGDETAFPDKDKILAAFNEYQQVRFDTVKEGMDGASRATGAATWADVTHRFVDRHILSKQSLVKFFANRTAPVMAKTPVFEYVEGEEQMIGKFPWAQPMKSSLS
jgi:2-polyprenyl-6-methoxyphenol hydroxylase-like FAD-dependent oxidoreductase